MAAIFPAVLQLSYKFPITVRSGGSRISRWGGGGRRPVGRGADLRRVHFLAKTYVKTKEMDPVGGARAGGAPWIRQWFDNWSVHSYINCCAGDKFDKNKMSKKQQIYTIFIPLD